jgi:hypothetical protein
MMMGAEDDDRFERDQLSPSPSKLVHAIVRIQDQET